MSPAIATRQTNPSRIKNPAISFGRRAERAFEIILDGQLIDEAGKHVATRRLRADRREARLLAEAAIAASKARATQDPAERSALLAELQATVGKLIEHDRFENADHELTDYHWDDSRDNRREACAVLDGLRENGTAASCGNTSGGR